MATALFINRTDLVRNSILDGNVDTDKFIQFIKIAQEIDIQNYTGTDLYNKISTLIANGEIDDVANAKYKTLLNTLQILTSSSSPHTSSSSRPLGFVTSLTGSCSTITLNLIIT